MKKTTNFLSVLLAFCLLLCGATPALAETPAFSDPVSAAAYIRAGMTERKPEIPFEYRARRSDIGELNDASLQNYFQTVYKQMESAALAHTGRGNEGDYLANHLSEHGYRYSVSYSSADTFVSYQVTFTASYHTNAAQEESVGKAVAEALRQLKLDGKTAYEKARAINDFICAKVQYDYKNLHDDGYTLKYSAYAALLNGASVCQGYANLFYRMALEAGLDCRILSGKADNGKEIGDHAWNIVRVDGRYYYMDVTWNDGTQSDRYFLRGKDGFGDHFPNAAYTEAAFTSAYPIADKTYQPGSGVSLTGDVDGDGEITSGDARLALRASVKLEQYSPGTAQFAAADVDGNGVIESSDARTILRVSVQLEAFA